MNREDVSSWTTISPTEVQLNELIRLATETRAALKTGDRELVAKLVAIAGDLLRRERHLFETENQPFWEVFKIHWGKLVDPQHNPLAGGVLDDAFRSYFRKLRIER